jgi:ferrous iron transport protein A
MTIADLKVGQEAIISGFVNEGDTEIRLAELGMIRGQTVRFIKKAPLGDPIEIGIMNYKLCIRKKDASQILCEPVGESGV